MSKTKQYVKTLKLWRNVVVILLITAVVFVLVEGLASTAIAALQVMRSPAGEASQYDRTLGWVGVPNADVPHMYGWQKYVRTNSLGFRNEAETDTLAPPGKLRIICAGDSFTYGQGVANDQTWCHRLTELDGRFVTVNIAQPGYGVDQMYLSYQRDGLLLEHSILIFAFVHGDLDRMAREQQSGYGKPVLRLEGGELVADNVPVPRFRWWLNRKVRRADLRTVDFLSRLLRRLSSSDAEDTPSTIETVGPIAAAVFRSIQRMTAEQDIVPVMVYLPTQRDLEAASEWRSWLAANIDTTRTPFIDVTPDMSAIPAGQVGRFFIALPSTTVGHYSEEGNAWVAELLYERLTHLPQLFHLLGDPDSLAVPLD
ncbi:MAG: SGNH/GDSL hydrolase family protein [Gemmatimonadota bacterium]|nr:MAG: SGNH/GDSL hydrolase family protein [Gemmatimonadota bacterium]